MNGLNVFWSVAWSYGKIDHIYLDNVATGEIYYSNERVSTSEYFTLSLRKGYLGRSSVTVSNSTSLLLHISLEISSWIMEALSPGTLPFKFDVFRRQSRQNSSKSIMNVNGIVLILVFSELENKVYGLNGIDLHESYFCRHSVCEDSEQSAFVSSFIKIVPLYAFAVFIVNTDLHSSHCPAASLPSQISSDKKPNLNPSRTQFFVSPCQTLTFFGIKISLRAIWGH